MADPASSKVVPDGTGMEQSLLKRTTTDKLQAWLNSIPG
jgi:hypothetical protein